MAEYGVKKGVRDERKIVKNVNERGGAHYVTEKILFLQIEYCNLRKRSIYGI